MSQSIQTAILGGGCFWCTEAVFDQVEGVLDVESGYAGGHVAQPSYEQVCEGSTGHAEVVKLQFDPAVISYGDVLEIFFSIHDPTQLNRQGNDLGTQYRSVVFAMDAAQLEEAQAKIRELQREGLWGGKFVTQVQPYSNYYPAEAYHQNYFEQHPGQGYCAFVVGPKVDKFRKKFSARLKASAR